MSKKKRSAEAPQVAGKVVAFNVGPKGEIEGAMVDTPSGLTQLNFPRHHAQALAKSMRVGSRIAIDATPEKSDGDHAIFLAGDDAKVTGTIKRLNYALHGEVNGYHLGDATFVHVRPDGARKYHLAVGDRITASGHKRSGVDATVVEAKRVVRLNMRKGEKIGLGERSYEGTS